MKLHTFKIQIRAGYLLPTAILIAGMASPVIAQTSPSDSILNRTVIVEQQYNPAIIDARKINVVPEIEELKVIPRQIEYDNKIIPATSLPTEFMDAYAGKEVQAEAARGYARLGYGMYGNLDAKANYLFHLSPKDRLNLDFSMDGRNGKLRRETGSDKWDNHFYRTGLGVNYVHQYRSVNMDIAGNFDLSNFNNLYMSAPAQKKFTSGGGHLGFASTDNELPVQFKAETNLLLYSRHYNAENESAFKETIVRTKADVTGSLLDKYRIGVAMAMDNKFYGYKEFDNFTTLLLNPYFEAGDESWNVHLGVNVDLAFGFGDKFNVSPDVSAQYIFSDSYILYAKATGGRISNDYRRLEQVDPFAEIMSAQPEDSYRQIHAIVGFKASPVNGLWFNIHGGYEKTKDDLLTAYALNATESEVLCSIYSQGKTNNWFAGADISYNFKDIFSFRLFGKYNKWDDKEAWTALFPEFTVGGEIGLRPIKPLSIDLSYDYIQRSESTNGERLTAVNNLGFRVNYELFNGISIYARAMNLLNKKYSYYLGYPDQGAAFLGGLSFRF